MPVLYHFARQLQTFTPTDVKNWLTAMPGQRRPAAVQDEETFCAECLLAQFYTEKLGVSVEVGLNVAFLAADGKVYRTPLRPDMNRLRGWYDRTWADARRRPTAHALLRNFPTTLEGAQ